MIKLLVLMALCLSCTENRGREIRSEKLTQSRHKTCYQIGMDDRICKVTFTLLDAEDAMLCYYFEYKYSAALGVNMDCKVFDALQRAHFQGK